MPHLYLRGDGRGGPIRTYSQGHAQNRCAGALESPAHEYDAGSNGGSTRISGLKSMAIPKVALVATALAGGLLVSTVDARPAQAFPSKAQDCTSCHGTGTVAGTVTAVPSTATPALSAAYTVAVGITSPSTGDTGYWIANSTAAGVTGTSVKYGGAAGTNAATYSVAMTAPAVAGTYYYKRSPRPLRRRRSGRCRPGTVMSEQQ